MHRRDGPTWKGKRATWLRDPPRWVITKHTHGTGKIFFVREGGFWERHGKAVEWVGPGDVLVRPPGVEHADQFAEAASISVRVEFDPQAWSSSRWRRELGAPLILRGVVETASVERVAKAIYRGGDREVPARVDGWLAALRRAAHPSRVPSWLAQLRGAVERDPVRSRSRAELAAMAGVHPVHLAQSFRRHFGTTLDRYVHRCRIFAASEAIVSGETPLAEVASELGYFDQSHLARVFRRERGIPPGAFRRSAIVTRF